MQWYQMPTFEKWAKLLPKFWIAIKNFYKGRDKIRWAVYAAIVLLIYFAYPPVFAEWKESDNAVKRAVAISDLGLECWSICGPGTPSWPNNNLDDWIKKRELLRKVCYSKNICKPLTPEEIENNKYVL